MLRRVNQELPEWAFNLSFERNPIPAIPQRALRWIRGYVNSVEEKVREGKGLWLSGQSGTGKTAAASLIVQAARERGLTATFANVPQLLTRLARVRWDESLDVHEEELHDALARVPLLVLDDLSASKTTPFALEQLYLIVNRRYNRAGANATIITTDLQRDELERMFGHRMIRRLARLAGRRVSLDTDPREDDEDLEGVAWADGPETVEAVV